MAEKKIFVGRKAELERFGKALEDPQGQAVLVVGQAGMGKTWLVNKMAEIAENHPELKCGWVRYEVTPTDSVDSTMALMMDNAFEAASTEPGSFDKVPQRRKQWMALLKLVKLIPAGKIVGKMAGEKAERIVELWRSLKHDPTENTREQFLKRLELVSERMPKNGRAVFIIDPEKYMQKDSDQSWAIVVKSLPERIKFVFAQRPEDALVESETFDRLDNVAMIPEKRLDVLSEEDIDELVKCRRAKLPVSIPELQKVLKRYNRHPYAIGAALDLIEAGTKLEELPEKPEPTKFAEVQWKKVCESEDGAIELFEAYAILEVGVPNEVVEVVSTLKATTRKRSQRDSYLRGLLREEGEGKRIYHAILADYIVGQIGEGEGKKYHGRAMEVYREKLAEAKKNKTKPDALSAMRLPEHVLEAEGKEAFVLAFVNECYSPLRNLGLLDTAINLSERALKLAEKGSEEEAAVLCTLGLLYRTKGDLNKAEKMHLRALEIEEKLGSSEGMANQYGNLGLVYYRRGELDKAEEMNNRVLEIEEKLGRTDSIANAYGNLGLIYMDRGDLDKAEEMHKKSLEIKEKLGLQEGMANSYGNLGLIYMMRGDLDKSEEMFRDGLKIDEKLGRLEGMANQYGNLGLIYRRRGELDRAEEMYRRSLEISEPRGMTELTANQYGNLGVLYKQRGDVAKAKEYWEKAVELYKRIGIPHMVKQVEGWIEGLSG